MSFRKVFTDAAYSTLQKTAFGSAMAVCVSTTCHYGVELSNKTIAAANTTYETTKSKVATSWGYELKHIPYVQPPKNSIELVEYYATAQGISIDLALSLLQQESMGKRLALSVAGAVGLMQIMPASAKQFCHITNPYELLDPETNIMCGMKILKSALVQTNWNVQAALQIYNLGRTCKVGIDCPQETLDHGRLIMARLGRDRKTWLKIEG